MLASPPLTFSSPLLLPPLLTRGSSALCHYSTSLLLHKSVDLCQALFKNHLSLEHLSVNDWYSCTVEAVLILNIMFLVDWYDEHAVVRKKGVFRVLQLHQVEHYGRYFSNKLNSLWYNFFHYTSGVKEILSAAEERCKGISWCRMNNARELHSYIASTLAAKSLSDFFTFKEITHPLYHGVFVLERVKNTR